MAGATGTFDTEQALAYWTQMAGGGRWAMAGRRAFSCKELTGAS